MLTISDLVPGQVYTNLDITEAFKCSPQGGMRRAKATNSLVIFALHHKSLYSDEWNNDIMHYTGMGQVGDQSINFGQNKTLAESNFKAQYGINLLILKRGNRTIEITKDTVIQNKDIIAVFGNKQVIKDLFTYKISENYDNKIIKPKENSINLIDNYGSDAMAEVEIQILPEILKDKKLSESTIRTEYNLNVLMIKRNDQAVKVTKDTIIEENDEIVVFGNYNSIKKIFLETKQN